MIVRLDLECDGQSVADVDDAGVFFVRAGEDAFRLGRKSFEQRSGVLVGAMFAPHRRENAQFGVIRFAAEDFPDTREFLRSQAVFFDEFWSDGRVAHGMRSAAELTPPRPPLCFAARG